MKVTISYLVDYNHNTTPAVFKVIPYTNAVVYLDYGRACDTIVGRINDTF